MPSVPKFWSIHIKPAQFYQTIRSLLVTSNGNRRNNSTAGMELQEYFISVRNKYDPHSIGMPITKFFPKTTHRRGQDDYGTGILQDSEVAC